MTSEQCLIQAIAEAESNLSQLDEDTKESIIAYSSSDYDHQNSD